MNGELKKIHRDFAKVNWVLEIESVLLKHFNMDFLNDFIIAKGADDHWHINQLISSYQELAAEHKIKLPKLNEE